MNYFLVTLRIQTVDGVLSTEYSSILQKYIEEWNIQGYRIPSHTKPMLNEVEGEFTDKEVDVSVLIKQENDTTTHRDMFKQGQLLIKEWLSSATMISSHF